MNPTALCCREASPSAAPSLRLFGWLTSCAVMIALPKCPMCLAGYIALLTGVSVPMAMAAQARLMIIALCILSLGVVCIRWAQMLTTRR